MPTTARRQLKLVGAVVGAAGIAALAGCGTDVKGDAATGKQLFTQRCGSCHRLADAGTKGTIGPDLDDAFKQDVADGIGRDTIAGVVRKQIELPMGPEMPADLVTGKDADSVAVYVAEVAGKRAGATGATGATTASDGGGGRARANARNQVEIPADSSGQLAYEFESAEAKAGKVTLLSKNDSPVPHDISIRGGGVDRKGNQVSNGGTSKVTAELKPARYEFYCSVPGHEQGDMKGTLTVR